MSCQPGMKAVRGDLSLGDKLIIFDVIIADDRKGNQPV